jgi:hypothetical protein
LSFSAQFVLVATWSMCTPSVVQCSHCKTHLLQENLCQDGHLALALGSILDQAQCTQETSTWSWTESPGVSHFSITVASTTFSRQQQQVTVDQMFLASSAGSS